MAYLIGMFYVYRLHSLEEELPALDSRAPEFMQLPRL